MKNSWKYNLAIERKNQSVADCFYRSHGYNIVNRTQPDSQFQKDDIDCIISSTFGNQIKGLPSVLHVSEKFRTENWDDMMIEIYSKYNFDNKTYESGWGMTTKADVIYYQTPEKTYLVDAVKLRVFICNFEKIYKDPIRNSFKAQDKSSIMQHLITPEGDSDDKVNVYKLFSIPTFNDSNESLYAGLTITISWDELKELGYVIGEWDTKIS